MNYKRTPNERPRARNLEPGDILSEVQGKCICGRRLQDYGYALVPIGRGVMLKSPSGYIVRRLAELR